MSQHRGSKKGKAHFMPGRSKNRENIAKQKEKFPKLVGDILRISDIILEVLDARFIEETRNFELEEMIKNQGKKIIYVLNKSDLIDIDKKKEELQEMKLFPHHFISCKERKGIKQLRNQIKIAVKKLDIGDKERYQVGIVGYPNTGKSSLINILIGKASARTGGQAGFTKGIQKIKLTSEIQILDTPGVIPEEEYSHTQKGAIQKHAKIGARTTDTIREPEVIIEGLMRDHPKEIEEFYGVDVKGDAELLIEEVGKKKNFLRKGGGVDEDRTARLVIRDWQEGRVRV